MDNKELLEAFHARSAQNTRRRQSVEQAKKLEAAQAEAIERFDVFSQKVIATGNNEVNIVLGNEQKDPSLGIGTLQAKFQARAEGHPSGRGEEGVVRFRDMYRVIYYFVPQDAEQKYPVAAEDFPIGYVDDTGHIIRGWMIPDNSSEFDPQADETAADYLAKMQAQLAPEGKPTFQERANQTLGLLEQAARNPALNPELAAQFTPQAET